MNNQTNTTEKVFLSIQEAKKQGNNTTNQEIKRKFISNHVYANVNQMTEYILNKGFEDRNAPFSFDDVENFYIYPEWNKNLQGEDLYFEGGNDTDKKEFLKEFERLEEESQSLFDSEGISEETHERNLQLIEDAKSEFENLETESQEVFEWWLVSDYLCKKLSRKGYVVIADENIWGRTTTGQAILLDYVITEICAEMEILEGQQNSWAN
jgi:hypothetical protein